MRRHEGDRVYGPYKQGSSYRVIIVRRDGERITRKTTSQAEAEKLADSIRGITSGVTMKASVEAYCKSLADRGLRFATYDRAEDHLMRLLKIDESGNRSVSWVARRGQELYDTAQIGAAVDSHRNALSAAKAWGRWCVKKGWLRADPFAAVEGMGRRRKGKPQLRVDEARRLTDYLLALPIASEPVAVMTVLILGNRASEIIERDVRDLDDDGTLLWVPDSKTENGKRQLEVPSLLQPLLAELAKDRIGAAPLFVNRRGDRPTRAWVYYWCKKLCGRAKVPVITPQGFRGTCGSLARRGTTAGHLVQAQLGHGSLSMTEGGSYVQREAIQAAAAAAVELRLIRGGKTGEKVVAVGNGATRK